MKIEAEHRSIAYACRSDWVIFTREREVRSRTESVISYYLYNPTTGKVIELLDSTLQTYPTDHEAFSIVRSNLYRLCHFLVPQFFACDQIRISTYTVGDEESYFYLARCCELSSGDWRGGGGLHGRGGEFLSAQKKFPLSIPSFLSITYSLSCTIINRRLNKYINY